MGFFVSLELIDFEHVENGVSLDFPEDGMLLFQPWALSSSDEKLALVSVRTVFVSHGDNSSVRELQPRVKLIHEGSSVDGLASSASSCWVTSLNHEPYNRKCQVCISKSHLHQAKSYLKQTMATLRLSYGAKKHQELAGIFFNYA